MSRASWDPGAAGGTPQGQEVQGVPAGSHAELQQHVLARGISGGAGAVLTCRITC